MYFPLFIDLTEKKILVVGAGSIALRRIRVLCGFGGHITVVARHIPDELRVLEQEYPVFLIGRAFGEADLEGKDLVLAATNDADLNRRISELCRARGIAVNVCTDASLCDFQFPSLVADGPVVIGINASGQDHHLVKQTRQRVEELFGVQTEDSMYL